MSALGELVTTILRVTDVFGVPVSGLTDGAFTKTLRRLEAGSLAPATETVTVTELASGEYYASFTPTDTGLYTLDVTASSYLVEARDREFRILAGFASSTGPYLTTRANVKTALEITGTADDARIDALIEQVSAEVEGRCDRIFAEATVTEYPDPDEMTRVIWVRRFPISAVTSLHISTTLPRVYDASTELSEGSDFVLDDAIGAIHLANVVGVYGLRARAVKVVYTGGYASIPKDLERAVIEVIQAKLSKGRARSYHVTSVSAGDGSLSGIRFDDWTDAASRVVDRYRRFRVTS